jgi:hypothetical protein
MNILRSCLKIICRRHLYVRKIMLDPSVEEQFEGVGGFPPTEFETPQLKAVICWKSAYAESVYCCILLNTASLGLS